MDIQCKHTGTHTDTQTQKVKLTNYLNPSKSGVHFIANVIKGAFASFCVNQVSGGAFS